jgi:steroid 5-alpha reductase family enzyme
METLVLANTVTALVLFALVWAVCVSVKNYGFLDVIWTLSIGLLALIEVWPAPAMLSGAPCSPASLWLGV